MIKMKEITSSTIIIPSIIIMACSFILIIIVVNFGYSQILFPECVCPANALDCSCFNPVLTVLMTILLALMIFLAFDTLLDSNSTKLQKGDKK